MTALWLLLAACPRPEDARVVKALPPVEAPPAPPSAPVRPDPEPGWRAGWTSAPPMLERPDEAWAFTLGGPVTAPLVGDGDRVYAVADGRVHAFSLDGKRLWEARIPGVAGVVALGDAVVAGGADGRMRWLDRATGRDREVTPDGAPVVGWPVPVTGGVAWLDRDGRLRTTAGWEGALGAAAGGRPAADADAVYGVAGDALVVVGRTGELSRTPLPGPPVDGPALDADTAYVAFGARDKEPGGVAAVARAGSDRGAIRWTFRGEFQPLAAPAVADRVYVSDKDGHLYALECADGSRAWDTEGYGEFTTQPLVVKDSLYVGNSDGTLARVDTHDGGIVWKVNLGAPVTGQPALVGDLLVTGLANGRVVALR